MLLAPIAAPESTRRAPDPDAFRASRSFVFVAGWLAAGVVVWSLTPPLRLLGHTPAFWLVAAPAIDLAWLARRRLLAGLAAAVRAFRRRPPRGAIRLRRRAVAQRAAAIVGSCDRAANPGTPE